MTTAILSEDSQSIVLLCSHLGRVSRGPDATKPLSVTEWTQLAKRLAASALKRPGALLGRPAGELGEVLGLDRQFADRLVALLSRGGQVAIELERLASRGIWVLTRVDDAYPMKLRERLKGQAPPVLFGAGPMRLLARDGLAVVGSREVDDEGAAFAAALGRRCA